MTSFYTGPERPRLRADSWEQLTAAAQVGVLRETHWVESKEAIPPASAGANIELARDLASLSVDGGALLVGIRNPGESASDVVGTTDDVGQLRQRIDQVTGSRIQPSLHIEAHPVVNPSDPSRAVLVINVPASADAPHMVDDRYWGRSDTGKRPLSDKEVSRLWDVRRRRGDDFATTMLATEELDPVPTLQWRQAHFYLTARPNVQPLASLPDTLRGVHPLQVMVNSIRSESKTGPSLTSLNVPMPHPDGVLVECSAFRQGAEPDERWLLRVLLGDDNVVRLVSAYGTQRLTDNVLQVTTNHILELTHQFALLVGYASRALLEFDG